MMAGKRNLRSCTVLQQKTNQISGKFNLRVQSSSKNQTNEPFNHPSVKNLKKSSGKIVLNENIGDNCEDIVGKVKTNKPGSKIAQAKSCDSPKIKLCLPLRQISEKSNILDNKENQLIGKARLRVRSSSKNDKTNKPLNNPSVRNLKKSSGKIVLNENIGDNCEDIVGKLKTNKPGSKIAQAKPCDSAKIKLYLPLRQISEKSNILENKENQLIGKSSLRVPSSSKNDKTNKALNNPSVGNLKKSSVKIVLNENIVSNCENIVGKVNMNKQGLKRMQAKPCDSDREKLDGTFNNKVPEVSSMHKRTRNAKKSNMCQKDMKFKGCNETNNKIALNEISNCHPQKGIVKKNVSVNEKTAKSETVVYCCTRTPIWKRKSNSNKCRVDRKRKSLVDVYDIFQDEDIMSSQERPKKRKIKRPKNVKRAVIKKKNLTLSTKSVKSKGNSSSNRSDPIYNTLIQIQATQGMPNTVPHDKPATIDGCNIPISSDEKKKDVNTSFINEKSRELCFFATPDEVNDMNVITEDTNVDDQVTEKKSLSNNQEIVLKLEDKFEKFPKNIKRVVIKKKSFTISTKNVNSKEKHLSSNRSDPISNRLIQPEATQSMSNTVPHDQPATIDECNISLSSDEKTKEVNTSFINEKSSEPCVFATPDEVNDMNVIAEDTSVDDQTKENESLSSNQERVFKLVDEFEKSLLVPKSTSTPYYTLKSKTVHNKKMDGIKLTDISVIKSRNSKFLNGFVETPVNLSLNNHPVKEMEITLFESPSKEQKKKETVRFKYPKKLKINLFDENSNSSSNVKNLKDSVVRPKKAYHSPDNFKVHVDRAKRLSEVMKNVAVKKSKQDIFIEKMSDHFNDISATELCIE